MPASTLPSPAPAPVSAEVRLAYVLRHFALAYPGAQAVTIGYAGSQPQVEIADLSGSFFSGINPYPPAPRWREWQGRQIPFFFDNFPEKQLLVFGENKAVISVDIISAAFYLLSGWQEYFSSERDRYGRFPYAASVQQKYNFVTLPVVNYYFDVLKTAVEYVSDQPLQPRRWGSRQATFAAFISHDVDNLRSAWKAPAKAALKRGKARLFSKLLWQHVTQPDAWNNLEAVAAATAHYGAKSTFFILPVNSPATNGTPNADYPMTTKLWQRLDALRRQGCQIAMHGSLGSATNAEKLHVESEANYLIGGIRFHYLCWEPQLTVCVVENTGFKYDSTLGFAEHIGFRHSYCQPFYPFNFLDSRAAKFLEIPLTIMDTTLHHPAYLQLAPDEILPTLQPVFAEIKRFGGVASVLWHNQNFDSANTQNGPRQFHEIMTHLQQQGAAFLTGREIWEEFSPEAPAPNL
ncbi:hypothetical protein A0257_05625 [Hymenobacter psoromatis]|nr:hypothetical protein A0257_05625 [Hymenobacter psoromatis]